MSKQEAFERKKKRYRAVYKKDVPFRETPLTLHKDRKTKKRKK
jgi:hypothetical protein